jgi:integrase
LRTATAASAIGRLRLDELDRPGARRLANTWPRNTSAVARTMWEDARRDGVCQENPWANLRLRQSRRRKDIVALTESEVHELADVAEAAHGKYGLEVRAMILVLAYTPVRPGELCALRWDDLDARERELHVRRSLDVTGSEKLPKNGKQRIMTVPPLALAAVLAMPRLLADDYRCRTRAARHLSSEPGARPLCGEMHALAREAGPSCDQTP